MASAVEAPEPAAWPITAEHRRGPFPEQFSGSAVGQAAILIGRGGNGIGGRGWVDAFPRPSMSAPAMRWTPRRSAETRHRWQRPGRQALLQASAGATLNVGGSAAVTSNATGGSATESAVSCGNATGGTARIQSTNAPGRPGQSASEKRNDVRERLWRQLLHRGTALRVGAALGSAAASPSATRRQWRRQSLVRRLWRLWFSGNGGAGFGGLADVFAANGTTLTIAGPTELSRRDRRRRGSRHGYPGSWRRRDSPFLPPAARSHFNDNVSLSASAAGGNASNGIGAARLVERRAFGRHRAINVTGDLSLAWDRRPEAGATGGAATALIHPRPRGCRRGCALRQTRAAHHRKRRHKS